MKSEKKPEMTLSHRREGLSKAARELLPRMMPVNGVYGARPEAQAGTSTGHRGVNPGVTPGFKAAFTAVINVAVNQGFSPLVSRATSSGLSAAVNRA